MKLKQRPLKEAEMINLFFIYARDKNQKILFLHPAPNKKDFMLEYAFKNAVLATADEAENIIKVVNKTFADRPGIEFKTLPFYTVIGRK